ncbi:hypothetical protein D3C87_280370 [compost metagenome]
MFSNPVKPNSNHDEGYVTEVDARNMVCKVKTIRGQNLDNVAFTQASGGSSRAGDRATPVMGDRVVIHYELGYPLIYGFLPKIQTDDNKFPVSIDTGLELVNTGNFTSEGVNAVGDQNKPGDILVGDRIIASTGGGILAVLRGGSLLLRSSRLAEIFISKWDDVVRVVSRNWEHFTDVSSDVVKNIKGRVYRYTGYALTADAAKDEDYQYNLYYGDTALAKAIKTDYWNTSASPAATSIIAMEEVPGLESRTVDAADGTVIQVVGSTTIKQTGTFITADFGGDIIVTVDGGKIKLDYKGQQTVTVDANQIELKHSGGATHTTKGDGVFSTFGGHFVNVTSGGVQMG